MAFHADQPAIHGMMTEDTSSILKPDTDLKGNGFFIVDRHWEVKLWSAGAKKLFGLDSLDMTGRNLWEGYAGVILSDFYDYFVKAFKRELPSHFDMYCSDTKQWYRVLTYHSGGSLSVSFRRSNQLHAVPESKTGLTSAPGQLASIDNPTQKMLAIQPPYIDLSESDSRWSKIAKQTINAIVLTNQLGEIIWVNDAFTRMTEYSLDEITGKKPGRFLQGPGTDPKVVKYLSNQIREFKPFDCNVVNYTKSGKKCLIHIQGEPLLDANGKCRRFFAIQTDITEKVLLEDKLEKEKIARQKEITDAVITAQENERMEIGRELHDNVNQILGAAKLYIEMAKDNEKNNRYYLSEASNHIANVIEEIRTISKALVPQSIDLIGVCQSIRILVDDLAMIHPLEITFSPEGFKEDDLNEKMRLNIFRIVQEQTNNIIKHATATHAVITLKKMDSSVELIITDDGKGCDTSNQKSGIGIKNIQSRAEIFHGHVEIKSAPGSGYTVKVILPLHADN